MGTLYALLTGVGVYGLGCLHGYVLGHGRACRLHVEFLRQSTDNLQTIQREFVAHLIEREDYHRSIIAWVRGKERT